MKLPDKTTLFKFQSTKDFHGKMSFLITGMPGCGKTTLAAMFIKALMKEHNVQDILGIDFPEQDKGFRSLANFDIPAFTTIESIEALDELYGHAVTMQPKGLLIDDLPSAWKMFFTSRFPSLIMEKKGQWAEGQGWSTLSADLLNRLIVRFRSIPSVEVSVMTSTIWPTTDDVTGEEGKLLPILPGKLRGQIYGVCSYCYQIDMALAQGKIVRVLKPMPDGKIVAKSRAPLGQFTPNSIGYDLIDNKIGIDYIVKTLNLT